jgi:putative endonuclease
LRGNLGFKVIKFRLLRRQRSSQGPDNTTVVASFYCEAIWFSKPFSLDCFVAEAPRKDQITPLSLRAFFAWQSGFQGLFDILSPAFSDHQNNALSTLDFTKQSKLKPMSWSSNCIYILSNIKGSVLYIGVTSNLPERINQHKQGKGGVFTRKYRATRLVYYECFGTIMDAINREKQLKGGSRADKIKLIESINAEWLDLSAEIGL